MDSKHPVKSLEWWREVCGKVENRRANERITDILEEHGATYNEYYQKRLRFRKPKMPIAEAEIKLTTPAQPSVASGVVPQTLDIPLSMTPAPPRTLPHSIKSSPLSECSVDDLVCELKRRVDSAVVMVEYGDGKYNFKVKGTKAQYKFLITLIGLHAGKEFDLAKDGIA